MSFMKFTLSFLVIAGFAVPLLAKSPVFICKEPGGKRLIEIDDNDINHVGEKIELRIDDGYINDRDGNHVLYVEDDAVRKSPTGVKLATFDGENLRHGKGGDIVLNYHDRDICPDPSANRIYSIEGEGSLSKPQLIAGMYLLKPELFKLTDAEEEAQKKAYADAAAEQDKIDHADQAAGNYMVLNSNGIMEHLGKGTITVGEKKNDAYPVTFDLTQGGGPKLNGVGNYALIGGDKTLWVGYGTPNTVGLCVYEITGGKLSGTWYVNGATANGSEMLSGPATLNGNYKIDSAKAPSTGAAYAGTVAIHPLTITGATPSAMPYSITWKIGGSTIKGIGIRSGKYLVVASGTGADTMIAKYIIQNGSMNADWYKVGSMDMGSAAATVIN